MNETLILLLGQSPEEPVRWGVTAGGRVLRSGAAPSGHALSEIAGEAAKARSSIAVLPGEQAAMRAVPAPPRAAAKVRAAAAYLLEDDLAENLDSLHIATMRHESGAGLAVAVKRSVLDAWRDAFDEAGWSPDVMTPDFTLLPASPDKASFIVSSERIIGMTGLQGFALERPMADAVAAELADDASIEAVAGWIAPGAETPDFGQKPAEWINLKGDEALFNLYTEQAAAGGAPNMLQGAYRKRRDWGGAVGPWRRAAMLAAVCIAALGGNVVADAARSERIASRLNSETLSLHQTAFPEAANADPRNHARSILQTGGGGMDFLHLATQVAESLESADGVQIDRVRYNASRGEFSVNMRFADINDLESLKRSLAGRGVTATEAGGVRRSGAIYVGELRVTP